MIRVSILVAACFWLSPGVAAAWSLETHLYIASKVLADVVDDGRISVCVGDPVVPGAAATHAMNCTRRQPVPPEVAAALQAHPAAFLAGTLGPDVYPDFVTAQVTVHPGIENGWGTDDWLRRLIERADTPESLAWSYGYLSHAAGDIFAHSWVNRYAGHIFDLGKHEEAGNEAELRHFLLERYIAWRTPTIWTTYAGTRSAPLDFVAEQLIFDRDATSQYTRQGMPAHLVAISNLRNTVRDLHAGAFDLVSRIHEIGLQELGPLADAERDLKLAELTLDAAQMAADAAQKALDARERLLAEAEQKLLDLAEAIDDNKGWILGWEQERQAKDLLRSTTEANLPGLRNAVAEAAKLAKQTADALIGLHQWVQTQACEAALRNCMISTPFGDVEKPGCKAGIGAVCDLVENPKWPGPAKAAADAKAALERDQHDLDQALEAISDAIAAIAALDGQIEGAKKKIEAADIAQPLVQADIDLHRQQREFERQRLVDAQSALASAQNKVKDLRQRVAQLKSDTKPVADFLARYDLLVAFLDHWQEDITKAAQAFVGAGEEAAKRMVDKIDEERMAPYKDWLDCWSPVLTAVPSEVPQTVCTVKQAYLDFKENLDAELNKFANDLGSFGWLLLPGIKLEQEFNKKVKEPFKAKAKPEVVKAGISLVTFIGNEDLAFLLDSIASKERVTGARLVEVYENDDSDLDLLAIPDIDVRVRLDAGLADDDSELAAQGFNALDNAIQLAKLALLGGDELNTLVNDLQGSAASRQPPLFPTGGQRFSLLLDAVRSIDGNEQWQQLGLPYPRSSGPNNQPSSERSFGRSRPGFDSGFLLWGEERARALIFMRLFKGPVSPAIEDQPTYAANFPFPACPEHPFPSSWRDGDALKADLTCRLLARSAASGQPGLFGALSVEPINRGKLAGLSGWDLRVARNEIFARYGYAFGPPELVDYFKAQPWYQPSGLTAAEVNARLSTLEWGNVGVIRKLERRRPLAKPHTVGPAPVAAAN